MASQTSTLRRAGTATGLLGTLAGLFGTLSMLGAFGPVSRWTARSSDGTVRTGSESGIDYLLGSTGGNAPVLFFWSMVLLALSVLAAYAVLTERRRLVAALALVASAITVIGLMSLGWYFAVPALSLVVAAMLFSADARRDPPIDHTLSEFVSD